MPPPVLTEDQQVLAASALKTAKRLTGRYARINPQHADGIESSACWGAVRAAVTFKDAGVPWKRWRDRRILSEIRDFLRSAETESRNALWAEPIVAVSCVDHDDTPRFEDREWLERALALLPPQQQKLCNLVYVMGMSVRDAGKALGYTPTHGCKIHREAVKMLKKSFAA